MWWLSLGLLFLTLSCFQVSADCSYGSIRLYGNTTEDFGLLQMCNSSRNWSAVCDYWWDCARSIVACRQLGYANPTRISYKIRFGPTDYFSFGPYYSCSSSYDSLFLCSPNSNYRRNFGYCNPNSDTIGLMCSTSNNLCNTNGEVRLVNGSNSREGRVEYCYNGQWSALCTSYYSSLTPTTAYSICHKLGHTRNSFASIFNDGRFGKKTSVYQFIYLSCSSGQVLSQCNVGVGSSTCINSCSSNEFGIRCHEPVGCEEGSIRLVNGTLLNEGRLEACSNGVWGPICYNSFGSVDALVVCKELGYNSGGTVTSNSAFSDGNGPLVYTSVGCAGHEKRFSDCSKSNYFRATCSRRNTVGVYCWDGCTSGNVRLTGGSSPNEGTVEICYDNIWGLVSQVGWDDDDAKVVCDQLGHETEDAEPVRNSAFGKPNRPVWLSNVNCDGLEDELDDCTWTRYSIQQARIQLPSAVVAGVRCQGSHVVTPTLYLADPGLGSRERAILGVGGTMIGIGIIAIITVIVVMCLFIVRQKRSQRSHDLEPLTQQKGHIEQHHYENKRQQEQGVKGGGGTKGVNNRPSVPRKTRGQLPKPPAAGEVEELYELS